MFVPARGPAIGDSQHAVDMAIGRIQAVSRSHFTIDALPGIAATIRSAP